MRLSGALVMSRRAGVSLSTDVPQAVGTADPGASVDAARADHVHPATGLAVAARTVDPFSGSGWTILSPSGGALATWAAGPARLSLSVPDGATGGCALERSAYVPESDEWDVCMRVDVLAGDGSADTRTILYVGVDANNLYSLAFWANGTLEAGRVVAGVYTSVAMVAGPSSGERTGAQFWLRLSRRVTGVVASWAVGSAGAVPAAWVAVGVPDAALASLLASCGTYVRLVHVTLGGVVGGYAVDVLALRLRGLAGVAL